MADPSSVLWVEKYRPSSLEEMALDSENRAILSGYLEAGEIPHLLLAGPPGSGKTTIARIIGRTLDCATKVLNASSDRGIDVVRQEIARFVTGKGMTKWRHVFLDEADAMTSDAQTALRNLVESYSEYARFILTCNYLHRIIGPIQSRCQVLHLNAPPLKERFRILANILQVEGIESTPQITLSYAERFPDLRKMIWAAQRASMIHETLPTAKAEAGVQGKDLYLLIDQKDWPGVKRASSEDGFDPIQALRDLFWAIPDKNNLAGFYRVVIGKAVHESGFTPDPIVHFLATMAEAMEGPS